MGPPPPPASLGGGVATVPVAVGPAGQLGPVAAGQVYCSAATGKPPQTTSNGYVAVTAGPPPSQAAAIPATFLPQVGTLRTPLLHALPPTLRILCVCTF